MPGTAAAVRRLLSGRSATGRDLHLLPRTVALPALSAGPASSVAYAVPELVAPLALAGAVWLVTPVAAGVAVLVALVVVACRQIVRAYPQGGGAYLVAREQLGHGAGLLAASALLVDLAAAAAVSTAAAAATLAAAFPGLAGARVAIALALLAGVGLVSVRGTRDARAWFAAPTYAFLAAMAVLLVVGAVRCGVGVGGCPAAVGAEPAGGGALTVLVVARAFAGGTAVVGGFERAANATPAFRYPQVDHARWTLAVTGVVVAVLVVGVGALAAATGARGGPGTTVIGQVAAALLGQGALFHVVQLATAAVLVLAALTALVSLPRLAGALARDGWLPRQLTAAGDRLAFSNGLLVLTAGAALLVAGFGARVDALVAAYVVAALVALACALAGVTAQWWRGRGNGWRRGTAAGAVATVAAVAVVAVVAGTEPAPAAVVVVAVAGVAAGMWGVRRNYRDVSARLRAGLTEVRAPRAHDAVIVLDRVDEPAARALSWVLGTHPRSVTAVGVPIPGADLADRWASLSGGLPLTVVADADDRHAPDRLVATVAAGRRPDTPTTVVLAEELTRSWGDQLRRHRLDLRVKAELRQLEGVTVADVTSPAGGPGPYTVEEPAEHHVLVLVSSVHTGVRQALGYTRLLRPTSLRALSINVDGLASHRLITDWTALDVGVPLEVVDSPFRSLVDGVRHTVRRFAPDGRQTVVSCVLPELVGLPPWARPLHSQSAATIRDALLFERGVVTITVPHRLPVRGVEPSV